MPGRARLLIIAAVAIALLLATVMRHEHPPEPLMPLPAGTANLFAAQFTDAFGNAQRLDQWRSKIVIVNFWATWCPPCRDEMPELSALQDKYRARGVVVLGIATDDAAKMQQFAKDMPVTYPLLAGDMPAMDLAASLGNDRDILPYTVILRRDGSVAARHFGRIDSQALESILAPLM
ncbi:thiol-disulfide oxidoreductase ResA [mine drainage metagenome]|uniref:Thiol-disulfide oxidoreductase ResA n=1 Tax=mine drainage metagenome TaxID=410659 RepID=A0A1J5QXZ3_9ZZZZ